MLQNLFFTMFLTAAGWGLLSAQKSLYDKKEDALLFFQKGKYEEVVATLAGARKLLRQDSEAKLCLAISYYQVNNLNQSLSIINQILDSEEASYPEALWYKARIYHSRTEFSEAVKWYKIYLKNLRPNDNQRKMVIDAIRRCSNGLEFKYKSGLAVVENLGRSVNTKYDEFAPVISPNHQNVLYFSSIRENNMGGKRDQNGNIDDVYGNYQSDMFSCRQKGGFWADPEPLHYFINSSGHDILLDFNTKGNSLFYFKGWRLNQGEIFIDTFKTIEERSISTTPFVSPINPKAGDGMLFIASDTSILFSSRQLGGFGGYDIYKITKSPDGGWSAPKNLGPDVNTEYDEITPFLARDGRTLYYSSNDSEKSIGGFDVFKTIFLVEKQRWIPSFNLGMPINSAGDDTYFRLARDGFTGFFCSSRSDGEGQRDLYSAYFKEYLDEMDYVPPPLPPPPVVRQSPKRSDLPPANPDPVIDPPVPEINRNDIYKEKPPSHVVNFDKPRPDNNFSIVGINPILRPATSGDFSREDRDQINRIGEELHSDPSLHLVISVYKPESQFTGTDLADGIAYGEKAASYLERGGIARSRIFVRALCSGFEDFMVFSFVSSRGKPLNEYTPSLEEAAQKAALASTPSNSNCFYKVQIVSLKGPITSKIIDQYDWPMAEKSGSGPYYRYTVGAFHTYTGAKAMKEKLRKNGAPDAFIVPYLFGMRATTDLIKRNVDYFPDLQNYLSRR